MQIQTLKQNFVGRLKEQAIKGTFIHLSSIYLIINIGWALHSKRTQIWKDNRLNLQEGVMGK